MNQTELEMHVKNWLRATLHRYDDSTPHHSAVTLPSTTKRTTMKAAWDGVMKKYNCCGLESSVSDFIQSSWYQ